MKYLARNKEGTFEEVKFTDKSEKDLYFGLKDGACFKEIELGFAGGPQVIKAEDRSTSVRGSAKTLSVKNGLVEFIKRHNYQGADHVVLSNPEYFVDGNGGNNILVAMVATQGARVVDAKERSW